MPDGMGLLLSGGAGLALGAVYFGGLWWTVRQGLSSPRPALWFLGSFVLRTGFVLGGIHLVADGRWQRLVACGLGFAAARLVVTRFSGDPIARRDLQQGTDHAS